MELCPQDRHSQTHTHTHTVAGNIYQCVLLWGWGGQISLTKKDLPHVHRALPFPRTSTQSESKVRQSAVISREGGVGSARFHRTPCDTWKCVARTFPLSFSMSLARRRSLALSLTRTPAPALVLSLSLSVALWTRCTYSPLYWSKAEWMVAHGKERKSIALSVAQGASFACRRRLSSAPPNTYMATHLPPVPYRISVATAQRLG